MKKDKLYTYGKKGNIFWPGGELNSYGWMPEQMTAINSYPVANTAANYGLGTYQAPTFQTATISSIQPQIAAMKPVSAPTTSTKSGSTDWGGIAGTAAAAAPREAFDILDPVYHLAAGRETKVGNALSDTGVGLFKAGASSGNAGLMIAGAAAKIGGGLINAGWGVKENKKNTDAIKENTALAKGVGNELGSASTNSDVLNAANNMTSSLGFKASDLYKNGWFTNKGTKKGNALRNQEAGALAYQYHGLVTGAENADYNMDSGVMRDYFDLGGPLDSMGFIEDMPATSYGFMKDYLTQREKQIDSKNKLSGISPTNAFCGGGRMFHGGGCLPMMFDFGGNMGTNSSDFPTGLTHIDAGGSHETNPNEGVQVGVDQEGTPNLVEEGETIFNDYVFSNRIELDDEAKKAFHIGKKRDITYAEMSKKLEKEASERPNDPISKAALKAQLQELSEHQERQKQEMEAERAREAFEALSPEEQTAVMQQVAQQEQVAQEQAMQEEAMAQQQAQGQQMQMNPEEAAMMQQQQMQGVPTANAMGAVAQPMVEAYGGEVNRFDYGGALKWLMANKPQLDTRTAEIIAKIIGKKSPASTDSISQNAFYNAEYSKLRPTINFSEANTKKYFDILVNAGVDKEAAFDIVYENKRVGNSKEERDRYNRAYKRLVQSPSKESNSSKIVYGKSANGLQTRTVNGVTLYRSPYNNNYYRTEKIALNAGKPSNSSTTNITNLSTPTQSVNQWDPLGVQNYYNSTFAANSTIPALNTRKQSQEEIPAETTDTSKKGWTYGKTVSGIKTATKNGITYYQSPSNNNYYKTEQLAVNAGRRVNNQKEEKKGEVVVPKQETAAVKPVEEKPNADNSKSMAQAASKSNTSRVSNNTDDGINVGTYRQEGNQWNTYGLPGLQQYLLGAAADYSLAETDEAKREVAQKIVDQINGLQQSYKDYIAPTLGQQKQKKDINVGNHQALYHDYTGNAGFRRIENGQEVDLTDEAVIKPEGHSTTDNLAGKFRDDLSGPQTWLRYFGATGDKLDDIVGALREMGIDYSPYADWTIGKGNNARQLYRASLINSPSTANEGFPEDATQFGDASNYTVDVNGEPDVDDFVEVDANGNPVSSSTANRNVAPVLRSEWPRYVGLFGPAVGLGMQALGIGKPDTAALDAVLEGYDKRGAAYADYKPIGNYITYRPMDIWAEQNRLNASSRATDRAIMNSTSPSRVAGLLASGYNDQLASGQLYRQALEYNDNQRKQVADFNRGTDMFNAQAYNQLAQFNASQRDRDRQVRAQLGMQAAAQKADMDAGWYNGIYGNVAGLFKGISDLGRENAERNMLARLAASGALGTIDPEGAMNASLIKYADSAAEGGKIKRKKNKRRGLTI